MGEIRDNSSANMPDYTYEIDKHTSLKKRAQRVVFAVFVTAAILLSAIFIIFSSLYFKHTSEILSNYNSAFIAREISSLGFLQEMNINSLTELESDSKELKKWIRNLPLENLEIKTKDRAIRLEKSINIIEIIINEEKIYSNQESSFYIIPYFRQTAVDISKRNYDPRTLAFNYFLCPQEANIYSSDGVILGNVKNWIDPEIFIIIMLILLFIYFLILILLLFLARIASGFIVQPVIKPLIELENNIRLMLSNDNFDKPFIDLKKDKPLKEIASIAEASNLLIAKLYIYNQELKEQKRELQMLNHDLTVSQQSLEIANQKLSKLDQQKTNFLSTVSHEFRTPLTSVIGFASLVSNNLEKKIIPELDMTKVKNKKALENLQENLSIIKSEGKRLANMVNEVLDLAKIEADAVEWKKDIISMEEIIEIGMNSCKFLAKAKQIDLNIEIEACLPKIIGDRNWLLQLLINLISNAIKFTEKGFVTCRVVLNKEKNEITVSVIDSGIGIPSEEQDNVFDKFKQIGDVLTDKPKGSGLGLAICKGIIENHNGHIWVESQLGSGSTFSFTIPLESGDGS